MNARLCVDCHEPECDCASPAKASSYTVTMLATDAYMRAGGDSVVAVLSLREAYRPLPGIDEADLIDRAQRWLVDGMSATQRQQLDAIAKDIPRYLAIAEARYRRAVRLAAIAVEQAA